MHLKLTVVTLVAVLCPTKGALLLWSKEKFQVSPLESFTDDNFRHLLKEMGHPETTIYKSSSSLSQDFKKLLEGYNSYYSPNGEINDENATEISDQDLDRILHFQELDAHKKKVLSIIIFPSEFLNNRRSRREILSSSTSTSELPPIIVPYKSPKGPVLYEGKAKNEDVFVLLYSSEPLLLTMNGTSTFLGVPYSSDLITLDTTKDGFRRLNINIPVEEAGIKVTLRFLFSTSPTGYWSLTSVLYSDTNNPIAYNLSISEQDATAPLHFSFHCSGVTKFTDQANNVELYIYDMQVQIDSKDGNFGDVYDCVPFTSGPILSGLLVTALLALGLVIALSAIADIKTMDKFDNHKTKQLSITVSE